MKDQLRRIMGTSVLSLTEFQTLVCLIGSCLNSRLLCAILSDPSDFDVLTPGHFLVGFPLNAIPEPDLTCIKVNGFSQLT